MATLVLRTVKGTPLTNAEVDGNFSNLNSESGVVFNRANTINSNVGVLSNLTTSEKSNIVAAINEIASESTSNVYITGGTIGGTAGWAGNTIGILYGGTGQTTRSAAVNALLPVQTSNVDYYLKTDGTNVVWANVSSGTNVALSDDTSTNSSFYPTFSANTSGTVSALNVSSTKLSFNPSTGILSATDFNSTSDIALKENITNITSPMDILSKLNGIEFTWKETGNKSYGLSAQEVEQVLPSIVNQRPDGYKGINYLNIIAFLVEAVKELKDEVRQIRGK